MRRLSWISLSCLVGFALFADCLLIPVIKTARAVEVPPAGNTSPGDAPEPAISVPQPRILTTPEWDAVNLGRAVDLWLKGDLRDAAGLLETIDISATSAFAQADRAAFLLAVAYLRLEDADAFSRVADRAAAEAGSPYRRWIRYIRFVESGRGGDKDGGVSNQPPADFPGAGILSAALLMEKGRSQEALRLLEANAPRGPLASIHLYMQALARDAAGGDPDRDWRRLAARKPNSKLEADLVGTALITLAIPRLENNGDVTALLKRVPRESRHAPRASHMLALLALETGQDRDIERAIAILTDIIAMYPAYEARRHVELALGGVKMDRADWRAALADFESAETDWLFEYESLAQLENDSVRADIWRAWDQQQQWHEEIRLAPEALFDYLARLAQASLDLRRDPSLVPDKSMAQDLWPVTDHAAARAAWDSTDVLTRHYPDANEWEALRSVQRQRRHTASVLARQEHIVAEQKRDLARRLAYLNDGRDKAAESAAGFAAAAARLESLLALLDTAVSQLEAVRDHVLLNIAMRTRDMIEGIRRDLLFVQALRHFHVDGPALERPEQFPEGVPSPAELLSREETLATKMAAFLTFLAEHYPAVITRSFEEIWEPRLTGDSRQLHRALLAELGRARRIGTALDSTMAWYTHDPDLLAALARRDELAATVKSLRTHEEDLRNQIARAVAARGRVRLEKERNVIDYHLSDASWALAVQAATDPKTAEDATIVVPFRKQAITRLEAFLARYPESLARGESRFRLADLRLMQARDDFQTKMAGFLGEEPSVDDLENRALAPFVNYAPAIALYEAILAEDPAFPHLDAVLFNLGMILSDDGQPTGAGYLARLVEEYPDSPDCQEAWLRLGSDRFDRKDFAGSVSLLEQAIAGEDPSFKAIALYKLGWAHFEEDHFRDSADAFRRLMDLYAANGDLATAMDLRDEAEEYLIHSLARSGGADAFRTYFDNLGGRDYEARILISLGHLMRSISLYEEAIACDELWLARYPVHSKAPAVAERLVDTYRSWNKPDAAREAKLAQAARFLPGTPWFHANRDGALRDKGQKFARSAYRETAAYHHRQARRTNDTASWQAALANYERYLTHWPNTADSRRMHFVAGEAASRLNRYASSLGHFAAAAASDSVRLAIEASWQQVAVADTWYRSSRPTDSENGTDSLATVLMTVGQNFITRFTDDERCADVVWRQGNVAYAHGWYKKASASLFLLGERYPNDPRAPLAARMNGDAYYRRAEFEAAGAAYEKALNLARTAGQDSVVAALQTTIPLCYYKHAESVADSRGSRGEREAAPLFSRVAERWPGFEHTDLALYRAGLGFAVGKSYADAASAWDRLLTDHPDSEYARDSAIQIAEAYEKSGNTQSAARAYENFSRRHPDDPDAPAALIKAVDLLADAKDDAGAEQMRSVFLTRFPGEVETVMEIRAARATRELADVTAGTSTVTSLLALSATGSGGAGKPAVSELQAYLTLAAQNPTLASPVILAQADFYKAEETYPAYASLRLTQPLAAAIQKKKVKLEELLNLYNRCTTRGVAEYSRAAAHRIGHILIEFGDALITSERPKGLNEDDLVAYDEVLTEQSWEFYDRGENVWSELLQQVDEKAEDPGRWITRTREALWPRLAQRFLYQPEMDYPLVAATPPEETESE